MPEHFVAAPNWGWYIVGYFFFGGIAGGAYVLGTMLRLWGSANDVGAARLAFKISFWVLLICPILLTVDLGRPFRFWHMLVDARTMSLTFKYWSPMSVGAWALLIFGVFVLVSFVAALRPERETGGRMLDSLLGRVFMIVGALLGLFIASYTGVLLSVSNQPVWSDTWALGGLFLASALSAAAAAIVFIAIRRRRGEELVSQAKLVAVDRYFIVLELVLLIVFFATLGAAASKVLRVQWIIVWLIFLACTIIPLAMYMRPGLSQGRSPLLAPGLVLLGNIALRAVIVFGAQA
jgi:formate-dependent nitrite reductase membrane component NrfD